MSGVLWWYSERIAKLEGQVTTLQHQIDNNSTSKDQINGLKNWIIAVYSIGEANGWKLPEPPQDTQQKKER
jgi:beta-lactamase superfamily II metal-dependent hydrolase